MDTRLRSLGYNTQLFRIRRHETWEQIGELCIFVSWVYDENERSIVEIDDLLYDRKTVPIVKVILSSGSLYLCLFCDLESAGDMT